MTEKSTIQTDTLMKRLQKTSHPENLMDRYCNSQEQPDLAAYLHALCRSRNTVAERIINKAGIDRTYGHQIFSGVRHPSRDKLLQLAVAFELTPEETQRLLRMAGKSTLYPKVRRDAVLIYGLSHHKSLLDIQEMLMNSNLTLLGEWKNG